MNNPKKLVPFLSIIAGSFYALGFPSFLKLPLGFLTLIGAGLFFYLLNFWKPDNPLNVKESMFITILFLIGFNCTGYYWIPYTMSEFGSIGFPFNYLLSIFASLIIGPQFYLFALAWIFYCRKIKPKYILNTNWLSLNTALIFTLIEILVPQQFPGLIGHPWLHLSPYLGLAPYIGQSGFSFFSFWLIFELGNFIFYKKINKFFYIIFSLFITLNFLFPIKKANLQTELKTNIRVVQANIGNFDKLLSEKGELLTIQKIKKRYHDLSVENSHEKIDLIIWPETAFPHLLSSDLMRMKLDNTFAAPEVIEGHPLFNNIVTKTNSFMFFGGYDQSPIDEDSFQSDYNSAFFISPEGEFIDVYRKQKLIPFGETLPFGPLNPFLSKLIQNISYFSSGDKFVEFKMNDIRFTTVICYEILFSDFIRNGLNSFKQKPHFIINLTNDSWYGNTAEPYQHLFLAKWRALEFLIPIVRSTNTGITSVIYPDGSESQRLLTGDVGKLDHQLLLNSNPQKTIFQIFGHLIFILIYLIVVLIYKFILKTPALINHEAAKHQ